MFFFIPLSLIIIVIIFSFKYKVTPSKQEILVKEIKRINNGGEKSGASMKVKEVCEELTGIKYE